MSDWIDYNMIMGEIGLHRSNMQRRIKEYRALKEERDLSESEIRLYENAVGSEHILMCIQRWVMDFKFSTEELMELDEFKAIKKEEP